MRALTILILLASAGAAHAEMTPAQARATLDAWRADGRVSRPDLDRAVMAAGPKYEGAPVRIPGVAKTAVDRTSGDLTGSLGFLCGLKSSADKTGAASYGYDQMGRFVGAKLSLAFR